MTTTGSRAIDVASVERASACQAQAGRFEISGGDGAEPRELPAAVDSVRALALDQQAVAEAGAAERQAADGRRGDHAGQAPFSRSRIARCVMAARSRVS